MAKIFKHKYTVLVFLGLAINLTETWLFGWHWHAQSGAESFWDTLSLILVGWGLIGDIASNLHIHKHYHSRVRNNITTKTVEVGGKNPVIHYHFGTTEQQTRDLLAKPKE